MTHLRRELVRQVGEGMLNRWGIDRIIWIECQQSSVWLTLKLFFTIPYTGTWGVVIGKATGAGACTKKKRGTQYTTFCLNLDLKGDYKHYPHTVSFTSNLSQISPPNKDICICWIEVADWQQGMKQQCQGSTISKGIPSFSDNSCIINNTNSLIIKAQILEKESREVVWGYQGEIRWKEDWGGSEVKKGTYIASIDHPILWRVTEKETIKVMLGPFR